MVIDCSQLHVFLFFLFFSLSLPYYATKQLNQLKGPFSHVLLPLETTSIPTGECNDYVTNQSYVYLGVTLLCFDLIEPVVVLVQVTSANVRLHSEYIYFLLDQSYTRRKQFFLSVGDGRC
jgi:hypothetical protein